MIIIKTIMALSVMIGFTVTANLLLKTGAMVPASERFFFEIISWKMILGVVAYGCAAVAYGWLLHWLPLNVAQSFAAAQFVAVILASALILSESISPVRWVGIALIASGILLVGLNSDINGADKLVSLERGPS